MAGSSKDCSPVYRVAAPLPRIRFWLGASGLALLLCGCATNSAAPNYRAPDFSSQSQAQLSQTVGTLSQRYQRDPADRNIVIPYAAALRSAGQPEQAIAALEQAMSRAKGDPALRVEYARALVAAGRFEQALNVIDATINPAAPDWTMLSIKGAALDQLGRHDEARALYRQAQVLAPAEPSLEANLGLSYSLTNELALAERHLKRAAGMPGANPKVRQNLALVIGLQGRFDEARALYALDLPPAEVEETMDYIRAMLTQQNRWDLIRKAG